MNSRSVRIPGPDHPITITPNVGRLRVEAGGRIVADTANALTLREAAYPPVHYIPRADVDMTQLRASDQSSYCPYKGDASYFDLPALGEAGAGAIWSYEAPYPAVAAIAGHVAFYPDRVTVREV